MSLVGTTRSRRVLAVGASLLLAGGIASGIAVSQVGKDEPPPTVPVTTPAGTLEIADPGAPVDIPRLEVVAESANQLVLRGPGTDPDYECLVVVPADRPAMMAMTGCDPEGVFAAKGAFLAEVGRDGSVSGAVLLPEGSRDVLLNGGPTRTTNGVVTFKDVPEAVTVTATTPTGRIERRMVGQGDYEITPGVRPPEHVSVLDE